MKYPLSIFSSSSLQCNLLTLFLRPSVVLVVLLLFLVETSVRFAIPENRIPKGSYFNAELRQKAIQLDELDAVNLMFSGSSIAAVNYSPQSFDEQLNSSGVNSFVSFNAGIRGCDYTGIALGLEKLFLSKKTPDYLVLIISPVDLDENGMGIGRSKQVIRSLNKNRYKAMMQHLLSNVSWLYGFNVEIRALLRKGSWQFDPARLGQRGYVDMGSSQRKRRVRDYELDSEGPISRALYNLVRDAVRKGISVVLVPVTGSSGAAKTLDADDRKEFGEIIDNLLTSDSVRMVHIERGLIEDERYIDNIHLSTEAATENSRRLSKRFVEDGFPW